MPLDRQVQAILEAVPADPGPGLDELPPAEARAVFAALMPPAGDHDAVAKEDRVLPGPAGDIPVRLYRCRPDDVAAAPVCVLFHGGGWFVGSIATHDALCTALAARSGVVIVSVEYRLAPETPFPGPLDDCLAATRWVSSHADELGLDPARLAVAGDSAGGNLAAAVALRARDEGGPAIAFQLLVYPALDHTLSQQSHTDNGEGYLLTTAAMRVFSNYYLGDAEATDPLASPVHAPDVTGLPPAHIITAEYDPLRDEGEVYGARLAKAGGRVTVHRYEGMVHGFLDLFSMLDQGTAAVDECAAALREGLAVAPTH